MSLNWNLVHLESIIIQQHVLVHIAVVDPHFQAVSVFSFMPGMPSTVMMNSISPASSRRCRAAHHLHFEDPVSFVVAAILLRRGVVRWRGRGRAGRRDVAVARQARRDAHLGGSRGGGEAAAGRCERASVDGVAGRAAHARAREERTPGVQVEVVDRGRAVDEVALPPARRPRRCARRRGVRAARFPRRGRRRSRSRALTPRSGRPGVTRRR